MADKYTRFDAAGQRLALREGVVTSAGAGDAGKLVALDGSGLLSTTVIPSISSSITITASENLAQGDWVNIWNSGGNLRVRKADATLSGGAVKLAHGFVLTAVTSGNPAAVYTSGLNTHAIQTGGAFAVADRGKLLWLALTAAAGKCNYVPPSSDTTGSNVAGLSHAANAVVQPVGHLYDINDLGGGDVRGQVLFNQIPFKEKHSVRNTAAVPANVGGTIDAVTLTFTPYLTGDFVISGGGDIDRSAGNASQLVFSVQETVVGPTTLQSINSPVDQITSFAFSTNMVLLAATAYTFVVRIVSAGVAAGSITNASLVLARAG